MNCHDSSGAIIHEWLDLVDCHVPSAGVAVDKYRCRSGSEDSCGAGDDGERWHDHLVSGTQPKRSDCYIKCRRATAHRYAMCSPDTSGKFAFELIDKRPLCRQPTCVDTFLKIA